VRACHQNQRFAGTRQFLGTDFQRSDGSIHLDSSYSSKRTVAVRGSVVMHAIRKLPNHLAFAFLALVSLGTWFGTGAVSAEECVPHCDYRHYYGPFDFTYVQPGLFGYPLCGPRGNCSPQLVYSTTGFRRGRITVRFPRLTAVRP
jgi:hypothetical protein